MAERILLCIEPDSTTVDEIRRDLEPYGFTIENIPNGDEAIEWGRSSQPALIILSVEPRKVGYAICNKLKRSPSLRDVPLVLISAEETLATFEQHRKLKSRADEYLLKPLDMGDLLAKIDKLVGLGGTPATTEEMDIQELDADSDIVIADDDDIAIIGSADYGNANDDQRLAGVRSGASGPSPVPAEDTREQRVSSRRARGRAGIAVRGRRGSIPRRRPRSPPSRRARPRARRRAARWWICATSGPTMICPRRSAGRTRPR